jgi:hypothetical protein
MNTLVSFDILRIKVAIKTINGTIIIIKNNNG